MVSIFTPTFELTGKYQFPSRKYTLDASKFHHQEVIMVILSMKLGSRFISPTFYGIKRLV